jgi:hypothetical protein
MKSQIPIPKSQANFKSPKGEMKKTTRAFRHLEFGNWDLLGIWVLGFGISRSGDLAFKHDPD